MIKCPALILAREDDPMGPLQVAEDLAGRLPADITQLVRLPGARHTIFRDRPDLAFPAVEDFIHRIMASKPAASPRTGRAGRPFNPDERAREVSF